MKLNTTTVYAGAAVLALGAAFYVIAAPRKVGQTIGKTAGDLAAGVPEGVGLAIGVPLTDSAKCQACIDARDWWSASMYCGAGTFIGALFSKKTATPSGSAPSSGARAPTPGAPATAPQPGAGQGPAPDFSEAPNDFPYIGVGA